MLENGTGLTTKSCDFVVFMICGVVVVVGVVVGGGGLFVWFILVKQCVVLIRFGGAVRFDVNCNDFGLFHDSVVHFSVRMM